MTTKKKVAKFAKALFNQSLTDGFIDQSKLRKNLKILTDSKPPHLVQMLKIFKRLISQKLSQEEVLIETADKKTIEPLQSFFLKKTRARQIKYRQNLKLVFGAKITHGDWIYDATLEEKLQQLTIKN